MKKWCLIVDPEPNDGSWNMAVDDYLFQSLGDEPNTFLRFYSWAAPTVSLGYSQKVDRVLDRAYCRREGIAVVRRITGGKLVLHDREVTYSLCSSDTDTFGSTLTESYRRISSGLMRGLESMGLRPCLADVPPQAYTRGDLPCFSYPARDEIEIGGLKIVGSAQKRVAGRFLQHGSIPLQENDARLRHVSLLEKRGEHIRMISLSQALGKPVDFHWAVDRLAAGLAEYFGASLEPMAFSQDTKVSITRLQKDRHQVLGTSPQIPPHNLE
ncbi:MAG: lipoate--protein ligase family protein [Candidatus Aminicenantaceae bacterium]